CALPAHADDKQPEPPPPPFSKAEYIDYREVFSLLGASLSPDGPLRSMTIPVAAAQRDWEQIRAIQIRTQPLQPRVAAAMVILGSTPGHAVGINQALLLRAGDFEDCWSIEDSAAVRTLDTAALNAAVRDDQALPKLNDRDPLSVQEALFYQEVLLKA